MTDFESEADLSQYIKRKLEADGYNVKAEVSIEEGVRVDLLAIKHNKTIVVEVKLDNHGYIANAISRCFMLSFSRKIDKAYVAFPRFFLRRDLIDFAKGAGIGIITVTDQGLKWTIKAIGRLAKLACTISHPAVVHPDEVFPLSASLSNEGQKRAEKVRLKWLPSGPFRIPSREKNHFSIPELDVGQTINVLFKVRVESEVILGKYPLMVRADARCAESVALVSEIPLG